MRTSALLATCTALAACGGGAGTTTATPEAPAPAAPTTPTRPAHDAPVVGGKLDTAPARSTEVGPVCAECLSAGGETSDFDGGRAATCSDFKLLAPASDTEAELAGYDVATYRDRLSRSFTESLRWTDLTASSARPRSAPIAGYATETVVRVSITTGSITKAFLDPARCSDAGQCGWNSSLVLDCTSAVRPSYALTSEVLLSTDDGALSQLFQSAVLLETPEAVAALSPDAGLSFLARVDVADVQGTLRLEPLPDVQLGTLTLVLRYFPDSVRGRLRFDFTNDWLRYDGTGRNIQPLDDQPLVARFPDDDCDLEVQPTPLAEPDARLSGRTPSEQLAALRASIATTDSAASWIDTGQQTALLVKVGTPDYACVTPGRIDNVPVRLSTADGRLDWSVLATQDLAAESAAVPARLSFSQELDPLSSTWTEVFGAFPHAPAGDRLFVRFRAEYPESNAPSAAHAALEISESSMCNHHLFACSEARAACLVAPPGAECVLGQ